MFRFIVGLILLCAGAYFAWDASNVLHLDSFVSGLGLCPDQQLTSSDIQSFDSVTANLVTKFGADTYADMEQFLSALGFLAVGISVGGLFLFSSKMVALKGY